MTSVQRYEDHEMHGMGPSPEGDWVKYDDLLALEKRVEEMRSALTNACRDLIRERVERDAAMARCEGMRGLLREARELIPANMQYRSVRHVDQWYDANDDLRERIDAVVEGKG